MPLESQLLHSIERRLKKLAARDPAFQWRKRWGSPLGITGDPDLYGLWHGLHFEVELKRPGESATPLQCIRLASWERAGSLTFVCHSLTEFNVIIDTIKRAALAKIASST